MVRLSASAVCCAVSCAVGAASVAPAQVGFELVEIGTLNGSSTYAYDVNNAGWVCGESRMASGNMHAFRWVAGNMTDLGTIGGTGYSRGLAISEFPSAIVVVGESNSRAFRYQGAMVNIGTLGGAYSGANAVSPDGRYTVGMSHEADGDIRAFRHDRDTGVMTNLGVPAGMEMSFAADINASGQIAIWGYPPAGPDFLRSYRYANGVYTQLPTLGGDSAQAMAINSRGWIVGESEDEDGEFHPFLWDGTTMTDLGDLNRGYGVANDVNRIGWVVGQVGFGANARAFLWRRVQTNTILVDLNTYLDAGSGWVLNAATGINDRGQIVGYGTKNGQTRAWMLNPEYPDGVLLMNDTVNKVAYVMEPDDGNLVGSFSTYYSGTGIEFADYGNENLLLSDQTADTIWLVRDTTSVCCEWISAPYDNIRGITVSLGGWVLGATATGLRAWNPSGDLVGANVAGDMFDVNFVNIGARHRFYLTSEIADDNVQSYDLDLNFTGQTAPGGVDFPEQIAVYNGGRNFAVAGFNARRIYKFRMVDGALLGSFAVNGQPRGVYRDRFNRFIVSTTTGLYIYSDSGTLVHTLLTGSGFRYITHCDNYVF